MTYETIPARVTVVGRIDTGDGRPDLIRSEYPAEFTPLEQGFAIAYDESDPPARVTLTCREGYALMERSGVPQSRMEFSDSWPSLITTTSRPSSRGRTPTSTGRR